MRRLFAAAGLCAALCPLPLAAADWPQWRFDAGHTASSPDALPDDLQPLWERTFSPREPAWEEPINRDLMPYDCVFEPVVSGKRLFLPFNDADKLVCLDTDTGLDRWTFFADGPIRLPPAVWKDRVFAASDDGCLYALHAETGKLLWKHAGAPTARKVLGNGRLISTWPARGGPVVEGDRVHYAAGIFPFMGTFLYSLDAASGRVLRQDDTLGDLYIRQPHDALAFGGVAPQGTLAVSGERLLVPGGRSVPGVFDLATGRLLHYRLAEQGKTGGSFVCATGSIYFNLDREGWTNLYDVSTGDMLAKRVCRTPVLTPDTAYGASERVEAFDIEALRRKPKDARSARRWEATCDATGDLIRAGNRLYAAGGNRLAALDLGVTPPRPAWSREVPSPVGRLLAADGKLFAVTRDGRILAYGSRAPSPPHPAASPPPPPTRPATHPAAARLLERTGARAGWALIWGDMSADALASLAEASHLRIIAVHPEASAVESLRRHLDARGLYGRRVSVHAGLPATFRAPPYLASLSVAADKPGGGPWPQEELAAAFASVRPYDGVFCADAGAASAPAIARLAGHPRCPGATALDLDGLAAVRRAGPLPGSAPWTHQYGSAANTVKSDDATVRLPLGLLWFGGNSHADILPRHGHGPPEQVIGGRLFIEGLDALSAWDVYTGRVLWKARLDGLGTNGVYYDQTHDVVPSRTTYNQVHLPGANIRGTNFVATADRLYVACGNACRVLDAASGAPVREIPLPPLPPGDDVRPEWGYLGIQDDTLLGGWGVLTFSSRLSRLEKKLTVFMNFDASTSRGLVAVDRISGLERWRVAAEHGFPHNGIAAGGGLVFLLDRLPPFVAARLKPETPFRLLALDLRSGRPVWSTNEEVTGTWLSYSAGHDVLLLAGRPSRDMVVGEPADRMTAYRGRDGKRLWDRPHRYGSPPILHGDRILTPEGRYHLLTGDPVPRTDPLSGTAVPWTYRRTYGCNYEIASEHLLTFRSGAAGFYDLERDGGTGNFGGFKSGCTSNLIAADGVLSAPDYTRTCSCSYPTQTSLALVHDPEAEFWTVVPPGLGAGPIRRLGINWGAPGNRRDDAGTLWIAHPPVGETPPPVAVAVRGADIGYYRLHSARLAGDGLRWVASSGLQGAAVVRIEPGRPPSGLDAFPVAAGTDDAEESLDGRVSLAGSDLELVEDPAPQVVGLRFANVTVPRGARIAEARVQFQADETSRGEAALTLHAEAADDAAPFQATPRNISARARTRASVAWRPDDWETAGSRGPGQLTPDIAPLIREVVSRPGWKSGNAIVLFVTGRGRRVAVSTEGGSGGAPILLLKNEAPARPPSSPAPAGDITVRLHFAEPEEIGPGARVFDVLLQGRKALDRLDIAREAGGFRRPLVKEIRGVATGGTIELETRPAAGCARPPVLGGIEVVSGENR